MKILPPLIALLAVLAIIFVAAFSSALTIDDMKCQVCDVAAAHYSRTILHAHLYCLNKAHQNTTDGKTQAKLSYLVKVLEPFAAPGLNSDFCANNAPAKTNPGGNAAEGITAAMAAKDRKQARHLRGEERTTENDEDDEETESTMKKEGGGAASFSNNKRESDGVDEVVSVEDSKEEETVPVAASTFPANTFAVDTVAATELARKNSLCHYFFDSFPAIELFPGRDGAPDFDPDDPKTYADETPDAVPPKFVELLSKACETALMNPRKNSLLVATVQKVIAKFPLDDAPRTVPGVRNHIYKNAIREIQEETCASNCPGSMNRLKNFRAVSAFSVKGKPIIQ